MNYDRENDLINYQTLFVQHRTRNRYCIQVKTKRLHKYTEEWRQFKTANRTVAWLSTHDGRAFIIIASFGKCGKLLKLKKKNFKGKQQQKAARVRWYCYCECKHFCGGDENRIVRSWRLSRIHRNGKKESLFCPCMEDRDAYRLSQQVGNASLVRPHECY